MKTYQSIGLVLVVVIFAVITFPTLLSRIQEGKILEDNRSTAATPLSYIILDGKARKVPDFLMRNQDSLYISNEYFLGKVYVVEFFFTRCPSICPLMNQNMKRLDGLFGRRNDFGIASFSIDPDHDTPSVLKQYASRYEVESPHWHFLTGEKPTIFELANSGFNIFASINPSVAGGFEHQGYFALIDKEGFIRSRLDAYGNPIVYYLGIDEESSLEMSGTEMLLEDVEKLIKE